MIYMHQHFQPHASTFSSIFPICINIFSHFPLYASTFTAMHQHFQPWIFIVLCHYNDMIILCDYFL